MKPTHQIPVDQSRGRSLRRLPRFVFFGSVAGLVGGLAMDTVTAAYMRRQSPSSVKREKQLQPEGTPKAMATMLAGVTGADLSDEQARRLGKLLHRSSGVVGGILIAALSGRRDPLTVGLGTAVALFLFVDEAAAFTSAAIPSPMRYPMETHLRGLVGHIVYGASVGAVLCVLYRMSGRREHAF